MNRLHAITRIFLTHSGHVPLTVLILEALLAHDGYFGRPDPYLLVAAGLLQALATVRIHPTGAWARLGINLVGPLAYTLVETLLEGTGFFGDWQHLAYWAFAMALGAVQALQAAWPRAESALVVTENLVRSAIPLGLYAVFEVASSAGTKALSGFFDDDAHVFLAVTLLLLGALLGGADVSLRRSFATIESLSGRLRRYAEWSFGAGILARAEADETALELQRLERAVVFMDVRGFTAWSESQSPEAVVGLLNAYYAAAESALKAPGHRTTTVDSTPPPRSEGTSLEPIKLKYTADEVMAVLDKPAHAVTAARRMLDAATTVLESAGLGAGAGVHAGPVVEGVLGGERHRAYDFIGDTVNTAQRLCDAAAAGEVLVSQQALGADPAPQAPWREIQAKGKRAPVRALALAPGP